MKCNVNAHLRCLPADSGDQALQRWLRATAAGILLQVHALYHACFCTASCKSAEVLTHQCFHAAGAGADLQYGLSGILEQPTLGQILLPDIPIPTLDTLLFTYAMLHWLVFDKTPQGFGMAALTAVCGPAVEMLLINVLQLYHYSHPVVLGVPTWIPWVYFCGGPAVGNLGRRVWSQLKSSTQ